MPLPWPFGGSTKWTKQLLFSYLENDDLVDVGGRTNGLTGTDVGRVSVTFVRP
jgi:hypothetical protein